MRNTRYLLTIIIVAFCCGVASAAPQKPAKTENTKPREELITVKASQTPVADVFASIAKQTKDKILIESTVTGNIDMTLSKVTLEQAIDTICKAAKMQWRKAYLAPDSEYMEQADKLAAVVRLTTGIGLPDVVVAKTSAGKTAVHTNTREAVEAADAVIISQLKMVPVYIITNDEAISSQTGDKSKVDEYANLLRKQMDMLNNMTPEELEQAIMASLNIAEQVDSRYMANMMHIMMKTDPQKLRNIVSRQNQMLFSMSQEDRRAMIKLGMQLQTTLTPEQMQTMRDDTAAVLADLQEEKGQ